MCGKTGIICAAFVFQTRVAGAYCLSCSQLKGRAFATQRRLLVHALLRRHTIPCHRPFGVARTISPSMQISSYAENANDELKRDDSFTVPSHLHGSRLDAVLAAMLKDSTRSHCSSLCQDGRVLVDGVVTTKKSAKLSVGSKVSVIEEASEATTSRVGGFVDTHCHLDMILPRLSRQSKRDIQKAEAKGNEPPQMLTEDFAEWRATLEGSENALEGCVTIGCSAKTLDNAATFLAYDGVHGAFGIHPLNANEWSDVVEKKLINMMNRDKVVALGECGLDFYDKDSKGQLADNQIRALQRRVFARQMDLAVSLNKPLIVHTRTAEEDTLELMKKHLPKSHKIHVHCFTSSLSLALALLNHFPNLHFGFTGVVTFKNSRDVQDVVKRVPLERILLETDGPYMAPEPFRGRVSHPGYVSYIADKIAELKGVSRQEVLSTCRGNTRFVYGF